MGGTESGGLTGMHNRQSSDERIKRLVLNAGHGDRRVEPSFAVQHNSLALFDIDHFKMVNDKFGIYTATRCWCSFRGS